MKLLSDRGGLSQRQRNKGYYLAPCSRCGRTVVHSVRLGRPLHMHFYSKACKRGAKP